MTSAVELTSEQRARIAALVSAGTDWAPKLFFTVDPAVVGGISLQTSTTLLDATVKGRLERLGHRLGATATPSLDRH